MGRPRAQLAATARAVRSGEVTATEVIRAALERAETSQARLNAFTFIDVEGALSRAAAIDAAISRGDDPGPLAGAPLAVKDLIDQEGLPTTSGANFPVDPAVTTAPAIARLESAGATIIGRTGLHEFAFGFSSENHWFGAVRNPWDPSLSPGGSSGGAGTAVGAGIVAGALGTDTGGSVRVPAALCGVVGLKVTHGRIPLGGVVPLAPSFDTVGPIAASVTDAGLLFRHMAGHDPADPWSLDAPVGPPPPPPDLRTVRLGVPHPWVDRPLSDEVTPAWDAFRSSALDAGIELVDFDAPDIDFPGLTTEAMYPEVAEVHRRRFTENADRYGPEVADRVAASLESTVEGYLRGLAWRRRMRYAAVTALSWCDALVTPAVAAMRKRIGEPLIEIAGEPTGYRMALSCFSSAVNSMGLPALTIPVAIGGSPPASIQLVGADWSESNLIALGESLEAAGIVEVPVPPEG